MTHSDGRSGESEARVEVVMIKISMSLEHFLPGSKEADSEWRRRGEQQLRKRQRRRRGKFEYQADEALKRGCKGEKQPLN